MDKRITVVKNKVILKLNISSQDTKKLYSASCYSVYNSIIPWKSQLIWKL